MKYAILLLTVLALVLTGCTQSGGFTFTEVHYSLNGGIGGISMEMTAKADGSVQVAEKGKVGQPAKLSAPDLAELKRLLARVDWPSLSPSYTDPKVADALFEGVVVKGAAKRDYTTMVGTGGAAPEQLTALLAHLQKIMKEHRPS